MATPSYLRAPEHGQLLTTQQVAKELGITYENVKFRIRKRNVNWTMQVGHTNLYDRKAIEKLR